ncbi:MAG: tetratricopeptide repeat protein, partial [Mangrovicoccus sp.]
DDAWRVTTAPAAAFAAYKAGDFARAEPLWQDALRLGELHQRPPADIALWQQNLAKLYYKQGRYDAADKLYAQAFPVFLTAYAEDPERLPHLAANYARNLRDAPPSDDRAARLAELQAQFGETVGTNDYKD